MDINSLILPDAKEKFACLDFRNACKEQFESQGVFDIPEIVDSNKYDDFMLSFYEAAGKLLKEKATKRHEEAGEDVTNGFSFFRIRLKSRSIPKEDQDKLVKLYEDYRIMELANTLNQFVCPFISYVRGVPCKLVNVGCFVYEEGDYIGIHHDRHRGEHINFQLPVDVNTIGTFRYMKDGLMQLHYDRKNGAKVLSSQVWHDVPPITRIQPDLDPLRIVYMLEYRPR